MEEMTVAEVLHQMVTLQEGLNIGSWHLLADAEKRQWDGIAKSFSEFLANRVPEAEAVQELMPTSRGLVDFDAELIESVAKAAYESLRDGSSRFRSWNLTMELDRENWREVAERFLNLIPYRMVPLGGSNGS